MALIQVSKIFQFTQIYDIWLWYYDILIFWYYGDYTSFDMMINVLAMVY